MNDIFAFRKQLVENYKKFSTSFASPRSNDIAKAVRAAYDDGKPMAFDTLWKNGTAATAYWLWEECGR